MCEDVFYCTDNFGLLHFIVMCCYVTFQRDEVFLTLLLLLAGVCFLFPCAVGNVYGSLSLTSGTVNMKVFPRLFLGEGPLGATLHAAGMQALQTLTLEVV